MASNKHVDLRKTLLQVSIILKTYWKIKEGANFKKKGDILQW